MQLWESYHSCQQAEDEDPWPDLRRMPEFINIYSCLRLVGDPIDPSTDLAEDDQGNMPGLFRSSIQPISVRQIVGLLTKVLPADLLRQVATVFNTTADGKDGLIPPEKTLAALSDLLQAEDDELDRLLNAPFYSISPVAPRESWIAEIVAVQEEWRERFELDPQRDRSSNHADYFRVWDMREGWSDGAYQRDDAHPLRDIAKEFRINESTAKSRYLRAFQLISGHKFTPENWFKLMGVQQLSELFDPHIPTVLRQRTLRRPVPREIDTTTISEGKYSAPEVEAPRPSREVDGMSGPEIASQILQLIAVGRTDDQIMDELYLEEDTRPAVEEIRRRGDLLPSPIDE